MREADSPDPDERRERLRSSNAVSRASVLLFATLLMVVCHAFSVAAQERTVVRAFAVGTLGVEPLEGTRLFGAGVTVNVTDVVQVFGDGALETGRSYPPDTPRPTGPAGPVFQIVLVEPHQRIDRLLVAGVRVSVPQNHRVRPFLELGAGLTRARNADVILTLLPQRTEYSSRWDRLASIGGGISMSLSKRIVVDAGYRWHQLLRDAPNGSFSALTASVGLVL
jgi:hypothetical protein